jgi:hypothetical protein
MGNRTARSANNLVSRPREIDFTFLRGWNLQVEILDPSGSVQNSDRALPYWLSYDVSECRKDLWNRVTPSGISSCWLTWVSGISCLPGAYGTIKSFTQKPSRCA